jgi:hypothetical protein
MTETADLIKVLNENVVKDADFSDIVYTNKWSIADIVKGLAKNTVLEKLVLPLHMANTDVFIAALEMTLKSYRCKVEFRTFDDDRYEGYFRFEHYGRPTLTKDRLSMFLRTPGYRSIAYLTYNDSIDALLRRVADEIKTNTSMTRLAIYLPEKYETPSEIFNALLTNKTLKEISWNYPQQVKLDVPSFIRLIRTNTTLTTIDIDSVIGPYIEDLLAIGQALLDTPRRHLLSLEGLNLSKIAPQLGFPAESTTWTNDRIMEEMWRIWYSKLYVWSKHFDNRDIADQIADAYYGGDSM